MNAYYQLKHSLKMIRWQTRRGMTALRWGSDNLKKAPAVLGNAMPKSGSHLIIQVLQGLIPIGPFVNTGFPPVNRSEDNSKLPDEIVLANIQSMRSGDINYGYISAKKAFTDALTKPGRATVFVYRDPRDMIVSHVFYATNMHKGHGMHHYYTQVLTTMEERIDAAIQGVDEPNSELSPVYEKYQNYLGWLSQPDVLSLRFEDLILDREASFGRLLDYLVKRGFQTHVDRPEALRSLHEAIAPQKSGTYRQGKPGNWREYFTDHNKRLFKESTSDLLVTLGYEYDNDW